MSVNLEVFTRDGCHLCEQMIGELYRLQSDYDFTFEETEITGVAELEERFGTKVPVLMMEQDEICHYFLDLDALKARLTSQT